MTQVHGFPAPVWDAEFASADRRRRTASAGAREFLARAIALRAAGDHDGAEADLRSAMERDPTDHEAGRLALAWFSGEDRARVARKLVDSAAENSQLLRDALRAALATPDAVFHRVRARRGQARGWIAWAGEQPLELQFANEGAEWTEAIVRDPVHPLAGPGYSVVGVDWTGLASVRLLAPQRTLHREAALEAVGDMRKAPVAGVQDLTVVVPIYDDYAATLACLESVFAQQDIKFSVILVDDCSPDPRISRLVEDAGRRPGVTALRNESNLGFAKSVNRALRLCADDDVLLLNADVWLPPRAVFRLRALVRADADIGTATPFSNNSQITSFPRPYDDNPTPTPAETLALDGAAEAANGLGLVDIPSGIGFCLYIARACLAAVGALPEHYGRGYYEDVEFCLRAAQLGFRNVCATGVFVTHQGSASFKSDKRELAVRNLAILEARFPRQGPDFLAFAVADPLRKARAAIEGRLPPDRGPLTVLLASEGRALWEARRRALQLEAKGEPTLVIAFAPNAAEVSLRCVKGGAPASLTFSWQPAGRQALSEYLGRRAVKVVEVFDAIRVPEPLMQTVLALGAPMDLFGVGFWWLRGDPAPRRGTCASLEGDTPCRACVDAYGGAQDDAAHREREARLVRAVSAARAIHSLDRLAAAFARRVFGQKASDFEAPPSGSPVHVSGSSHRLGILAPMASLESDRIAVRLARRLAAPGEAMRIVVLGSSLAEDSLLATDAAWVTGPADPEDFVRLCQQYGVDRLAVFDRGGLFGPLDKAAGELGMRKAYFDYSFGGLSPEVGDLAMDPRLCDDKAAALVALWLDSD